MPLTISDDELKEWNLTEKEASIEIACRLFDADRVDKHQATAFCGLTRADFENELIKRGLPLIRYTEEMLEMDLQTLEQWRQEEDADRGERHVAHSRAGALGAT